MSLCREDIPKSILECRCRIHTMHTIIYAQWPNPFTECIFSSSCHSIMTTYNCLLISLWGLFFFSFRIDGKDRCIESQPRGPNVLVSNGVYLYNPLDLSVYSKDWGKGYGQGLFSRRGNRRETRVVITFPARGNNWDQFSLFSDRLNLMEAYPNISLFEKGLLVNFTGEEKKSINWPLNFLASLDLGKWN